jgi:hypothetical protein
MTKSSPTPHPANKPGHEPVVVFSRPREASPEESRLPGDLARGAMGVLTGIKERVFPNGTRQERLTAWNDLRGIAIIWVNRGVDLATAITAESPVKFKTDAKGRLVGEGSGSAVFNHQAHFRLGNLDGSPGAHLLLVDQLGTGAIPQDAFTFDLDTADPDVHTWQRGDYSSIGQTTPSVSQLQTLATAIDTHLIRQN